MVLVKHRAISRMDGLGSLQATQEIFEDVLFTATMDTQAMQYDTVRNGWKQQQQ